MNSEEIKNEFINCIEGTHTLNLAISILEERDLYHSIIKEVREYIEHNKQYAELEDYEKNGEYYIDEIGLLEILDKVDKENNNER